MSKWEPWSAPHMRAERAHSQAARAMETGDVESARAFTRTTIHSLLEFLRCLDEEERVTREREAAQREHQLLQGDFDRKLAGEHIGP